MENSSLPSLGKPIFHLIYLSRFWGVAQSAVIDCKKEQLRYLHTLLICNSAFRSKYYNNSLGIPEVRDGIIYPLLTTKEQAVVCDELLTRFALVASPTKQKKTRVCTIMQLVRNLLYFPPETKVLLSSDEEGNYFGELSTDMELSLAFREDKNAVVLYPINVLPEDET